jgi:hypothetical protein
MDCGAYLRRFLAFSCTTCASSLDFLTGGSFSRVAMGICTWGFWSCIRRVVCQKIIGITLAPSAATALIEVEKFTLISALLEMVEETLNLAWFSRCLK